MAAARPQIWRDWVLFGARWVVLIGFATLILSARGDFSLAGETQTVLLIAAGANILFALILISQVRFLIIPTLLVTDWLMLGALVWLSRDFVTLLVPLVVTFMLLTLFRPDPIYTLLHIVGAFIIVGAALYVSGQIAARSTASTTSRLLRSISASAKSPRMRVRKPTPSR